MYSPIFSGTRGFATGVGAGTILADLLAVRRTVRLVQARQTMVEGKATSAGKTMMVEGKLTGAEAGYRGGAGGCPWLRGKCI
jgi:hypothetical protein